MSKPDELLARTRQAMQALMTAAQADGDTGPLSGRLLAAAGALSEAFAALDDHMTAGGPTPVGWAAQQPTAVIPVVVLAALHELIEYNWADERADYRDWLAGNPGADPAAHIFHQLEVLHAWVQGQPVTDAEPTPDQVIRYMIRHGMWQPYVEGELAAGERAQGAEPEPSAAAVAAYIRAHGILAAFGARQAQHGAAPGPGRAPTAGPVAEPGE